MRAREGHWNGPEDAAGEPAASSLVDVEERLGHVVEDGLEQNFARVLRFLRAAPGEWIELQSLRAPAGRGTRNRYAHVDSAEGAFTLLRQADAWGAQGVFVIANRVNAAVATRSAPRMWHHAEKGASTTDRDVTHRRVLFIDVDALRTSGTSATDDEIARTVPVARAVFARLAALLGSDAALGYGHSGNGRQIFVAIEPAPESPDIAAVIKGILAALSVSFTAKGVEIDRTVSDAKRLVPAFGTVKRKGAPNVAERPHRRTAFVCAEKVIRARAIDLDHLLAKLVEPLSTEQRRDVDRSMGRSARNVARPTVATIEPRPQWHFARANAVAVADVAHALGLVVHDRVRCPGCANTDGVALVGNGLKCHHKSCADRGVPGSPGFRTPVDIVSEVRALRPFDAAMWILEQFEQATHAAAEQPSSNPEMDDATQVPSPARDNGAPFLGRNFALTDLGNAERFIAHHGRDVRYCHPWKAWLVWSNAFWRRDRRGEIELRASQTVAALGREGDATKGKKRLALRAHATASQSANALTALIKLARSRPHVAVVPEDLDRDPWAFNCRNGTLDLREGRLRPHDRHALITKLAPVDYGPNAVSPRWCAFLDDVMGGNAELVAFLQRAVGYSLSGSAREQVLFFLHGAGANGKSTFLRTLLELFGDYGLQTAPDLLIAKNNDAHPTAVADLFGRRLAVCQEIEGGRSFAEATVKQLTGEDVIRARHMREDFWSFAPTHKLFLAANHKPNVRGTDHAIWRRIRLVPFTVTVPEERRDPHLLDKLRGEHPGILRWAVEGCLAWQRDGLRPPPEVASATAEYRDEQDVFSQFVDERCERDPTSSVSSADLYVAYVAWSEKNGCRPLGQRTVANELRSRHVETFKGPRGGERRWRGIRLRAATSAWTDARVVRSDDAPQGFEDLL